MFCNYFPFAFGRFYIIVFVVVEWTVIKNYVYIIWTGRFASEPQRHAHSAGWKKNNVPNRIWRLIGNWMWSMHGVSFEANTMLVYVTLLNVYFRSNNTISLMFTACHSVYERVYESLCSMVRPFNHYPQMNTKTICLRLHRPKIEFFGNDNPSFVPRCLDTNTLTHTRLHFFLLTLPKRFFPYFMSNLHYWTLFSP